MKKKGNVVSINQFLEKIAPCYTSETMVSVTEVPASTTYNIVVYNACDTTSQISTRTKAEVYTIPKKLAHSYLTDKEKETLSQPEKFNLFSLKVREALEEFQTISA